VIRGDGRGDNLHRQTVGVSTRHRCWYTWLWFRILKTAGVLTNPTGSLGVRIDYDLVYRRDVVDSVYKVDGEVSGTDQVRGRMELLSYLC
jgi:hypothetical protein